MREADARVLRDLRFPYQDTVRKSMRFEYHIRPCYYTEDIEAWSTPWDRGHYSYLFEEVDGELRAPPLGMRSSVPLGGLGAGTVELRADGSLHDWTIFNNSPAGGGAKVQLDEALFAVKARSSAASLSARALRTHPPRFLPGVEAIEYSGSYPVSRLTFRDRAFPFPLTLYAASEFHLRSPERSATPAALFTFVIRNPGDQPLDASLLFVLPNHTAGTFTFDEVLALRRDGTEALSGSMAVGVVGDGVALSAASSDSFYRLWEEFSAWDDLHSTLRALPAEPGGPASIAPAAPEPQRYGALSARLSLAPGRESAVTFVLGWHFPHRRFSGKIVGNFYSTLYRDAADVVRKASSRLEQTWQGARAWHELCFDSTLPEWLQDAMVNSAATMAKTGLWVSDGRWRQWESFSCASLDPIHIHYYRVLPYAWFFPELRRSQMRGFAAAQRKDGYIQENLGGISTDIDQGGGRMMGDGPSVFVLEAYQDYAWTGDRKFLDALWPSVRAALLWQIERSRKYGLPDHLDNSYDWWEFDRKELVSYNAFLHIAAVLAGERIARVQGDAELVKLCQERATKGRRSVIEHLWTGEHYRSWWLPNAGHPDALHADTLYGQLWAEVLGLGDTSDPDKMRGHLRAEKRINGSPFGLKVMRGTGSDDDRYRAGTSGFAPGKGGPVNDLVWETGSIDWCALGLYLGADPTECLEEARRVLQKWQIVLKDPWDIRDLTTGWDGFPWCNSHYARQLMLWAIPLALSGQQYDAADGTLRFSPRLPAPSRLPFFTPTAHGTLELRSDGSSVLSVGAGEIRLDEVSVGQARTSPRTTLKAGDTLVLKGSDGVSPPEP